MKLALLALVFLLSSCATYIKGDLATSRIATLDDVGARFEQVATKARRGEILISGELYTIDYTYDISGIGNKIAPFITACTLGIVPLYSTNNADVELVVKRQGVVVLKETLDSRFHTTYGWLAINAAEKNASEDLMDWHEGDSMEGHMIKTLDERVVRYIRRKLL